MVKGIDYIGITCIFFCHDGNGKILMHKRSKNCRDEIGNWDIGEPDAMDELGWFRTENLPDPLHSQFPKTLAILKKEGVI